MDLEKHLPIKLFVYLVIAFFAFVILAIGFGSLTKPMIDWGSSSVGNYTTNTTYWTGFTSAITASPLLIWIFFGSMIAVGVWVLFRHVKLPGGQQ